MERSALDFRVPAYNLAAVKSPLAQMNVMPVETPILTVEESTLIPPGTVDRMGTRCLIAPYDLYGYRFGIPALSKPPPFWTRYSLGVWEAARMQLRGDMAVDERRYMTPQQTANARPDVTRAPAPALEPPTRAEVEAAFATR